ncbi:electrogenic sodium bicarbonate cotransporter 1-like isoform X2 [Ruditapes philippinarum]|uniref:electrogenic sodium bicarbonate cotransporter 1-like isoform X2 n=1 Tax=Ruditapes philippinarum TaxID=129788 RepID=UPI00295B9468|nr:electrogenic sodium bicarbonate cotransporter 1-like isoform X2 [Ruditapes philippinarum]
MDSKGQDENTRQRNGAGGRRGSLYANLQLPNKPKRPHIPSSDDLNEEETAHTLTDQEYFPVDIVQNVLNNVKDKGHKSHNVFCQLDTLKTFMGNWEWRETARWVKFEEVVEEGGKRWSKPHVASLSMHAMLETRKMLMEGSLLLDLDIFSMGEMADELLDHWIDHDHLDHKLRQYMRDILLRKHKHSHVPRPKEEKKEAKRLESVASTTSLTSMNSHGSSTDLEGLVAQDYKPNSNFMRKIPKGSEVCNIMVGELEDLHTPILGLIRLKEARLLEGISEVKLPTRFVACIFGPRGFTNAREVGRCIATMMTDDVFREVAYKSRSISDLIAGLDEFVEQVTVLPPSEWNPKIRIEPPQKVQSQMHRRMSSAQLLDYKGDDDDEGGHGDDPTLQMSKIPFNGLYNDIKRKIPWYWSDYKDGIHIQCLAAFVYVFLGTFTPNVTFGGLLGQATDQYMGVMECIFAAAVTGIIFALFSGQPLNILGSTGPMLVLETIIYNLCKDNDWDFMPARVWIGFWTSAFILLIVIFNLSALVKYITRFTEESFATLIAVIFIVEAFKKLFEIETDYPVNGDPDTFISTNCSCIQPNCSALLTTTVASVASSTPMTALSRNLTDICANITDMESMNKTINWDNATECVDFGGYTIGDGCNPPHYVADVFFFSVLLFLGTFGVAVVLKDFKMTTIFPTFARQLISDFAVLLSIIIFVVIDILVGINTPKLLVPEKFEPTRSDRGWLINPISDKNPWWLAIAAAVPALLSVILIFLDQQITAVIVNRKENKLKKGVGYHLDMFVVAITVAIHSILGLPWYVAATVSALAHVNSLKRESECTAPGEKPQFLGCRENRLTALAIGVLSGAAVFITAVLKVIPMPVLYGVFFYMGFSAMRGMQLVDRLFLFVQPVKYQPDLTYLRHVQLYRVHIFTVVQVLCLGVLWAVKSIKAISIGFPLMVLATGVVRKILECYYTQYELKYLDDLLPGKHAEKPGDKERMIGRMNYAFDEPPAYKPSLTNGEKKKPVFFVDENDETKINDTTSHL